METVLSSERLILRPLTTADITDGYVQAMNDPEVLRWTEARHVCWTRDRVVEYVQRTNTDGSPQLWGIFLKGSDRHIGNVRLFNVSDVHRRGELAFLLFDKTQWSKGYGTEAVLRLAQYAFAVLRLHRIVADYYATNLASARLFAKAGFSIEGAFKDHFRVGDRYIDSVRVAKLNPDES